MERFVFKHLNLWKNEKQRKPLLVRGARQVGKTHAIRELGNKFQRFVEVNFEQKPELKALFDRDLSPQRIIRALNVALGQEIIPGDTLLFFDEIQEAPQAITALRYFYEQMPELHVIAAGSLIEFAIRQVGIPVGRVESLYIYPMSFMEFLLAKGEHHLVEELMQHSPIEEILEPIHQKCLSLLGEYFFVGGLPEAVAAWVARADIRETARIHQTLIDTYRQDFSKYTGKTQLKHMRILFDRIPLFTTKKFKYTSISDSLRKREIEPCLDALVTAGVAHQVFHSAAQAQPLGAQATPDLFKAMLLDIGLSQAVLGKGSEKWLLGVDEQRINRGEIVESFVGQELLAYADPHIRAQLYYWHNEKATSMAEVDYVCASDNGAIPIEVKSGHSGRLKSLHQFLQLHRSSPFGLRFYAGQFATNERVKSFPLYAIASAIRSQALS